MLVFSRGGGSARVGSVVAPPLQKFNRKAPQTSRPPVKTCKPSTRGSHPLTTNGIRRPTNHPSIRSKAGRERIVFPDLRRRPRYPRGGGNAHGIRGTLAALALIGSYALPITQRPNVMRFAHPRGGAPSVSLGRDPPFTLENTLKISQKVKRKNPAEAGSPWKTQRVFMGVFSPP